MKLEKALRAGAHIHYHDNGAWAIYERAPSEEGRGLGMGRELCEGSHENRDGYLPDLVKAMAEKIGMTADSI